MNSENVLVDREPTPQCNKSKIPIYLVPIFGLQVVIAHAVCIFYEPLIFLQIVCLLPDDPIRREVMSISLILCGLTTVLQTKFGLKLPVISTPSHIQQIFFLVLLKLDVWKCPPSGDLYSMGTSGRNDVYLARSQEIRGFLITTAIAQGLLCFTSFFEMFALLCSPTVMGSVMIASSLIHLNNPIINDHFSMSLTVLILILLTFIFSKKLIFSTSRHSRSTGCLLEGVKLLKLLPLVFILLGISFYLAIFHNTEADEESQLRRIVDNDYFSSFSLKHIFSGPKFFLRTTATSVGSSFIQNCMTILNWKMIAYLSDREKNVNNSQLLRGFGVEAFIGFIGSFFGVPLAVNSDPSMVGLIYATSVKSKRAAIASGIWLVILGLFSKSLLFFIFVPSEVFHAVRLAIQAMVFAAGISILDPSTIMYAATSVTLGMVIPNLLNLGAYSETLQRESSVWITAAISIVLDQSSFYLK